VAPAELAGLLAHIASAHLMRDDAAAFRTTAVAMVKRFDGVRTTGSGNVLRAVAPLRDGLTADEWLRLGQQTGGPTALAVADFRAGKPAEAVRKFAARHYYPRAWDMFIRAMAHQQTGQPAETTVWLNRAREWKAEADRVVTGGTAWNRVRWEDWNEKAEVRALFREAEGLIGPPARK
jgi:hypothetical protein